MISFQLTGTLPRINTDLRETMAKVSDLLKASVQRNFVEGGRPSAWEATKPQTVESQAPLFRSGRLFGSIENASDETSAEVSAGSGLGSYPFVHQFGSDHTVPVSQKSLGYFWYQFHQTGDEKWKAMAIVGQRQGYFVVHVPARPFMMFQDEDIERIMELVGNGLVTFESTEAMGRLDALSV